MNSKLRREIAERTINIIESGNINGLNINEEIQNNIQKTFTINPAQFETYLETNIQNRVEKQELEVVNCSTIQAILNNKNKGKIGVLNFASAKNPGGGFLGGASAQEESLARSSSLYASLKNDMKMYEYNRESKTFSYSDFAKYSPETVFWFNDEGQNLSELIKVDVITSPAPNKGAMLQHNRKNEIATIEDVFRRRIEFVFKVAYQNNIDVLILGAWGCGVFRNEVADVARYFKEIIAEKVSNGFAKIVFAIYDSSEKKSNYLTFKEIIEK